MMNGWAHEPLDPYELLVVVTATLKDGREELLAARDFARAMAVELVEAVMRPAEWAAEHGEECRRRCAELTAALNGSVERTEARLADIEGLKARWPLH